MNTSRILLWALGVIVIIGLVIFGFYLFNDESENGERNGGGNGEQINIDTSDWETYRNEEYGFSLQYPGEWEVVEETDHPVSVMFNFYKPESGLGEPPYDHHSSEVTHVSVFPQGIPTEGISGESVSSEVDFGVEVVEPRDYVLSDGTPFATQANFSSYPSDWNESGFVFANTPVSDLEVECERDCETIPEEECEVLMGDTPVRHGSINERDRAVEVAILESFDFIETTGEEDGGEEELVRLSQPEEGGTISSPVTITGEARGNWYFEGDFPVRIEDSEGEILGEHYATAQGEWMTEDFVEFESEFSFDEPDTATGTLILEKANPSGLPENEDEIRIQVWFDSENTDQERSVNLYYYNPSLDEGKGGNVLCSEQGLVAVERDIPITQTPIQDTVRLLLEGDITEEEESQGLTTEYPLEEFSLEGASLNDGVLTLEFSDPENQTSGGSCRAGILWSQIENTAEQFENVEEVRFQPEELFQP